MAYPKTFTQYPIGSGSNAMKELEHLVGLIGSTDPYSLIF